MPETIRGTDLGRANHKEILGGGLALDDLRRESDLIVWPRSEADIRAIASAVRRREKAPLIAYGAGSGVTRGVNPLRGGVLLDVKKLDRIIELDERLSAAASKPA